MKDDDNIKVANISIFVFQDKSRKTLQEATVDVIAQFNRGINNEPLTLRKTQVFASSVSERPPVHNIEFTDMQLSTHMIKLPSIIVSQLKVSPRLEENLSGFLSRVKSPEGSFQFVNAKSRIQLYDRTDVASKFETAINILKPAIERDAVKISIKDLMTKNSFEPLSEEISEHCGVSVKKVREIIKELKQPKKDIKEYDVASSHTVQAAIQINMKHDEKYRKYLIGAKEQKIGDYIRFKNENYDYLKSDKPIQVGYKNQKSLENQMRKIMTYTVLGLNVYDLAQKDTSLKKVIVKNVTKAKAKKVKSQSNFGPSLN